MYTMVHGVGYLRYPEDGGTIHLWKISIEDKTVSSYCGEYEQVKENPTMAQVDSNQLDIWRDKDMVCDECVEAVAERYP